VSRHRRAPPSFDDLALIRWTTRPTGRPLAARRVRPAGRRRHRDGVAEAAAEVAGPGAIPVGSSTLRTSQPHRPSATRSRIRCRSTAPPVERSAGPAASPARRPALAATCGDLLYTLHGGCTALLCPPVLSLSRCVSGVRRPCPAGGWPPPRFPQLVLICRDQCLNEKRLVRANTTNGAGTRGRGGRDTGTRQPLEGSATAGDPATPPLQVLSTPVER